MPRFVLATTVLAFPLILTAQVVSVPSTPQIGSSNPATAEPPVSRPDTKPCVVTLFADEAFQNYTPYVYDYTPPSACPGPWAEVVFTGDFTVSEGRQYDRTAAFYLGHANIYYGTTAEPRATLSPSWHVERDVTDLSAIFKSPQTGQADLGNFVGVYNGVTYNGIIYVTAKLEFYPTSRRDPAPRVPDVVVPVNGSGGDAGTLNTTTDQITQTLNLPQNVEQVYLDVIAQSQSNDEFWYLCVPNDQAANLESCGNTAFRETEISIDGKPAGVAPVYPWIYTGGLDPYLWEPIPGVQTLDFKPYRVDLTPFAGVLADGSAHVVAVSVYNANSYFLATANLLAFVDHGKQKVTGGLLTDTLSAEPSPTVTEDITTGAGPTYTGSILVTSNRQFTISGYVNTSHGRVQTTVQQSVGFSNKQQFDVSATQDTQNAQQTTTVHSHTTTQDGFVWTTKDADLTYPLTIDFSYIVNSDNSSYQTTKVKQGYELNWSESPFAHGQVREQVESQDTLNINASGALTGNTDSNTKASYFATAPGYCYSRTITAAQQKLTNVLNGIGCQGGWRSDY